jgi:hypothetical protein
MSPLPGWRLVWSLYGRFWCRSSLEVLSVAHGRAGMWSRAMWRGPTAVTDYEFPPGRDANALVFLRACPLAPLQ